MKCEYCGKEHNGMFGSGRFCNISCSTRYADTKVVHRPGFSGYRNVEKANKTKAVKKELHYLTSSWDELTSSEKKRRILETQNNSCNTCKIKTWNNISITLELHHKDGDKTNENYDNLEYLCPNCHSQTKTFRFNKKQHTAESRDKISASLKVFFGTMPQYSNG